MRHSVFGMESNSRWISAFLAVGRLTWSGVDLFFVLSGFLIGGILLDARDSTRYFKTFYIRRIARIFPVYFTVAAIFLVWHALQQLLPGKMGIALPLTIPPLGYLTLTQNFWMVRLNWFGPAAMAATWSLAVEEQFYLTIPFLIRKINPQRMVVVLCAVIAGAPLLRVVLHYALPHGDFACYVLMPCRADALCLGVLSAFLVRNGRFWRLLLARRFMLYWSTAVLFAGIIYMTYKAYGPFSPPMNTLGYSWLALFYTCCLLIAVSTSRGGLHHILCSGWLMRLGTLAYCTYLIHSPLIFCCRRLLHLKLHDAPMAEWLIGGFLGVALTLAIAAASWKYLEKPLLRRGHRYSY